MWCIPDLLRVKVVEQSWVSAAWAGVLVSNMLSWHIQPEMRKQRHTDHLFLQKATAQNHRLKQGHHFYHLQSQEKSWRWDWREQPVTGAIPFAGGGQGAEQNQVLISLSAASIALSLILQAILPVRPSGQKHWNPYFLLRMQKSRSSRNKSENYRCLWGGRKANINSSPIKRKWHQCRALCTSFADSKLQSLSCQQLPLHHVGSPMTLAVDIRKTAKSF